MATDIDMASNALILIGDDPISSFTESGAGAQAAANLYEDTYYAVLSEHPWTFALKEQYLNKLTSTPDDETGYDNAFQMPTDLIRLWAVFEHQDYTIVGNLLYSNASVALARYVYKVDESRLPSHFIKAMEYKLASEFAISVTEDTQKALYYENKFRDALARAKNIDSQQKPQTPIIDSPFVDVRLGGGRLY